MRSTAGIINKLSPWFTPVSGLILFLASFAYFFNIAHNSATAHLETFHLALYNGDLMYPPAIFEDYLSGDYPLTGWAVPPAPAYFPDLFIYVFARIITGGAPTALILYAIIQYGIFIHASVLLGGLFYEDETRKRTGQICVFLFTAILITLHATRLDGGVFHPLLNAAHHGASLIMGMYCLYFLSKLLQEIRAKDVIVFLILAAFTAASDKFFIVEILIPMTISLFVHYLVFPAPTVKRRFFPGLLPALSILIGLRIARFIKQLKYFQIYELPFGNILKVESERFSSTGLPELGRAFWHILDFMPPVFLSFWLLAALSGVVYYSRRIYIRYTRTKDNREVGPVEAPHRNVISGFIITNLFAVLAGGLFMILFLNMETMRYFLPLYFLPPFLFVLILVSYINQKHLNKIQSGAPVFALCLALLLITQIKLPLSKILKYNIPLAECLDQNKELYDLKYGLGNYWHSKPIDIFSKKGVRVNQVTANLGPWYWLNNYYWFLGKEGEMPEYNFVIIDKLDRQFVIEKFGDPTDVLACPGSEVFVYRPPGNKKILKESEAIYKRFRPYDLRKK